MKKISDPKELDALPDGVVVHEHAGFGPFSVWVKDAEMGWGDMVWWQGAADVPSASPEIPLPVFVIHEGSRTFTHQGT